MKAILSKAKSIAYILGVVFANTLTSQPMYGSSK
jgi:hypothetical protein